ncbi:MAG: hypothetical protein K8T90_13340 [Planctomycetes bacterium]|nr:hypothetical protein [Planctomycetota bacterium]
MTDASNDSEPAVKGGIFREWVLPIGVGLIIGAAAVMAWKHGRQFLQSDAEKLVQQWSWGDFEENDRLEAELKKLGKDARSDLLQAWRRMEVPADPDGEDEAKTWAAQILASDPYFDTRSIVEIVRDPSAPVWDRRTGAAALTHTLHKDVDPTAVVEPLMGWLEASEITDHIIALTSIRQLRADSVFPPDQEDRLRKGLLHLVSRTARPAQVDEYGTIRVRTDRERGVRAISSFVTHDDVKDALWQLSRDDADDIHVRVAAIQTLAGNSQFDDPEKWKSLAAAKDDIVRQCVAENLVSCNANGFDGILATFHADAAPLVRKGSIETQAQRGRPSMLPVMDVLLEDSDQWVRHEALISCGLFKEHLDGQGARKGMILRLLETASEDSDIEGAIVALNLMTGQSFGFAAGDVDGAKRSASDAGVAAFKSDRAGRAEAVAKWRAHLGGDAVWTDGDRKKTLEKLLTHADPLNVERAKAELAKLAGGK